MTETPRDYSRLPWGELQSILEHINPEVAPENYARLVEEIERRRPQVEREIEDDQAKADQDYAEAVAFRVAMRPYLGWVQIVTAVLFAWGTVEMFLAGDIPSGIVGAVTTVILATAGVLLIRASIWGQIMTAFLAVVSAFDFILGGIVFGYNGLASISFTIFGGEIIGFTFGAEIAPTFFFYRTPDDVWMLSVNLIAIGVLGILYPTRQDVAAIRAATVPGRVSGF